MLLLLLIYVVLSALWKIDVYLISTLVNKSIIIIIIIIITVRREKETLPSFLFKRLSLLQVFLKVFSERCRLVLWEDNHDLADSITPHTVENTIHDLSF